MTASRGASSSVKRSPRGVEQLRALAADRLGDQDAVEAGAGQGERGRVELAELEVGEVGAGGRGEDRAGADRPARVGRAPPERRGAAGRQHRRARRRARPASVITPWQRSPSLQSAVAEVRSQHLDPLLGGDHRRQLRGDLVAGLAAAGVDDAPRRVAALEPERQPPFVVEVEDDAARLQVADRGRRLLDQHPHRGGPAEAAAGGDRVRGVAARASRPVPAPRRARPAPRSWRSGRAACARRRRRCRPARRRAARSRVRRRRRRRRRRRTRAVGGYRPSASRRIASSCSRSQAAAPSRARARSSATALSASSARRSAAAIRSSAASACASISLSRSSAAAIACSFASRSRCSSSSWRSRSCSRSRSASARPRSRSASSASISASARRSAVAGDLGRRDQLALGLFDPRLEALAAGSHRFRVLMQAQSNTGVPVMSR